jgi:hypothetical protein
LRCLELILTCTMAMVAEGSNHPSPQQNVTLLLPHRSFVVRQLAACLDDKKRAVRLLAVRVRNVWVLTL